MYTVLLLVTGCASMSGQTSQTPGAKQDLYQTLAPKVSYREADTYYAYLLAQQYLRTNKIDKAIEAFGEALKQEPESPFLLTELATLYLRQGNTDKATELAQQAASASPFYEPAHMLLGGLYAGLGQGNKAIEIYQEVIANNPQNDKAYLLLGTLLAGGQ